MPHPRTKYTHTLGSAGVGTARGTPQLSAQWAGAGKAVNFGATKHSPGREQGWYHREWGSSSHSPGTHSHPGPQHISNLQRNTAKFKALSQVLKIFTVGHFSPYLTLTQTFTVGENGFSSMHSCPGNMWGITITAFIPEQGENSNVSTSGLPEQGQFYPLLAKSSLKGSATVPNVLYNSFEN